MIRTLRSADTPELLSLLHWMDAAPEREVFCPDARSFDDLMLENAGKNSWVLADDLGNVTAFAALSPFHGGLVLEGPLAESPAALSKLVQAALSRSDAQSVYSFCARDNLAVRAALEAGGFTPMHTTDFYQLKRRAEMKPPALPEGFTWDTSPDPQTYLALYRAAEDIWSDRLEWSQAHLVAHLQDPDIQVVALRRGAEALGFAEVELGSGSELALMTYLAVSPAARGRGYGKLLLRRAVQLAFEEPQVSAVQVRAHDHESPARALYARSGFTHCRSVVTYLLEPEGEEA